VGRLRARLSAAPVAGLACLGPLVLGLAARGGLRESPAPAGRAGAAVEVVEFDERERAILARLSPLGAPPADPTNAVADDLASARLGRRLFFEKRLSGKGEIHCAHCHDPERAFSDGKQVSEGVGKTARNAPGLIGVAWQRWLFWDGRADTLWAQALHPIEQPLEMDGDRVAVARLLKRDPLLRDLYEGVFGSLPEMDGWPERARPEEGDGVLGRAWRAMTAVDQERANRVFSNVGKAVAAYERRLIGGPSPFDRFVRGLSSPDPKASAGDLALLDPSAQRGLKLFIGKAGCRQCHTGPSFSDGEFHDVQVRPLSGGERTESMRLGAVRKVLGDPFNAAGPYSDAREGAAVEHLTFLATQSESWGAVRTPGLRNVALTAPYMEQGQFADLAAVLRFYSTREGAAPAGHHQEKVVKPLNLTPEELGDLQSFLLSLTEEPPPEEWRLPPP
jgi:cytochrome c peroxidase